MTTAGPSILAGPQHAEESAAGHGIIGRIRIISSTLEQTLEAATAGITAALEAATMGYTPPAPVRGASRSRRRERIHNQKRNVKWVDLEAPCGTTGFAATVCEGDANPRTMQVWKRSRSHESYEDMGGQGETTDQQHIVFRALADKERKETQSFVARALHDCASASADGDDDTAYSVAADTGTQHAALTGVGGDDEST